jgi:hypothetical protein
MFCPQCRTEYRPGFEYCSDCGHALVDVLPPQPAAGLPNTSLVTVGVFANVVDADLARTLLVSAGIESILSSENVRGGIAPLFAAALGIQVMVRDEDVIMAKHILTTSKGSRTD